MHLKEYINYNVMTRIAIFRMKRSRLWDVSECVQESVLKRYGKNRRAIEQDVEMLQEWLKTQLHLPEILDAHSIRNFLLMNKCSIEKTKAKIDNYYTVRSVYPELHDNTNPKLPEIQKIMDTIYMFPLPKVTKNLERVLVYKVRSRELIDELNYRCFYGYVNNLGELMIKESFQLPLVIVVDASKVSVECVKRFAPHLMFKEIDTYQKVLSFSPKAIYVVNAPSYISIFVNAMKMVLKPKIFQRIQFLKDVEELKELIPKNVLPEDYGGEEKSLEELSEDVKLKFVEYGDFFDRRKKMRVNESLRAELKNDDFLGFHGSFKKLEID